MLKKLIVLIIFGIAFGFVEASVVYYLRLLLHYGSGYMQDGYRVFLNLGIIAFVDPTSPILGIGGFDRVEIAREFSTIAMLAAIAFLAGKTVKERIGAFLISFAVWDIFYYVFLYLLAGWPKSLFDLDVYFLIPVTWVGPVITPIVISVILFIVGIMLYLKKSFRLKNYTQ